MILAELSKSPAVVDALMKLNRHQLVMLDLCVGHLLLDPFSRFLEYWLEETLIDGDQFELLRGRFRGGFISILFSPDDEMHLVDLLPLHDELQIMIDDMQAIVN